MGADRHSGNPHVNKHSSNSDIANLTGRSVQFGVFSAEVSSVWFSGFGLMFAECVHIPH